tara:strand:+ start:507 stop:848 length:342 start_codon:yes stop_codon:yes gene_type:complete
MSVSIDSSFPYFVKHEDTYRLNTSFILKQLNGCPLFLIVMLGYIFARNLPLDTEFAIIPCTNYIDGLCHQSTTIKVYETKTGKHKILVKDSKLRAGPLTLKRWRNIIWHDMYV